MNVQPTWHTCTRGQKCSCPLPFWYNLQEVVGDGKGEPLPLRLCWCLGRVASLGQLAEVGTGFQKEGFGTNPEGGEQGDDVLSAEDGVAQHKYE